MAITTLEDVKDILDITNEILDSKITRFIPVVEADYLRIRNAPFRTDEAGETTYPVGSDVVAALMVDYQLQLLKNKNKELSSRSIDNYSESFVIDKASGYPRSIVDKIQRYINASSTLV